MSERPPIVRVMALHRLPVIDYFDSSEGTARLAFARRDLLLRQYGSRLFAWLSVEERRWYEAIGSREYAEAWLCGRVVAKELMESAEAGKSSSPDRLTIKSRNQQHQGTAPSAWRDGRELPVSLSISHTERAVLVALAKDPRRRVGVDLIQHGTVGSSIREMWFTSDEQSLASRSPAAPAQIWAAKEATYKTLNVGESFYPLRIVVECREENSCACRYRTETRVQRLIVKTWETEDGQLAAFAAANC